MQNHSVNVWTSCLSDLGGGALTAEAAGPKTVNVNVTDSFGTQTVTINATAN